jgi:hypothetical protein
MVSKAKAKIRIVGSLQQSFRIKKKISMQTKYIEYAEF